MILPFHRYFDFKGRSRRIEVWAFSLTLLLVNIISARLITGEMTMISPILGSIVYLLISLFLTVPTLALYVRRLHDTGRSGFQLLFYVLITTAISSICIFLALQGLEESFLMTLFSLSILALLIYSIAVLFFFKSDPNENKWGYPDEG
jgi:uncharacterized membrane protein YhaH (DUF805 family)